MSKLLATDLDGTLFYPKHRVRMISNKALLFLRKFIDEGNKVAIVSSRNEVFSQKVIDKINRPLDIIGNNGALIVIDKKMISNKTIEPNMLKEVSEYIEKTYKPKCFIAMSDDNQFVFRQNFRNLFTRIGYLFWYFFQGVYREPYKISKDLYEKITSSGHAVKVMIMIGISKRSIIRSGEITKELREHFKNSVEFSWSNEFIELSPKGVSKSSGLKYFSNYHNINDNDIYVVGDSGNDISLFKEFHKNSFSMEHAPLSVSKYASHKIKHFEDIEDYIYERK